MKIGLLLLLVGCLSSTLAAPLAEQQESSIKTKRGLTLGLGYHAPLLTHSHYIAPATTVLHHAPIISHAPLIAHTPIIAHHPISYHLPAIHSIHHF